MWRKCIGLWLRVVICLSCLGMAVDRVAAASAIHSGTMDDRAIVFPTTTLMASGVFSTDGVISGTLHAPLTTLTLTVQLSGATVISAQSPPYTAASSPALTSWVVPVSIPAEVSGTLPFTLTMHVGAFEIVTQQMSASIAPAAPTPSLTPSSTPTLPPPTATPTPAPSSAVMDDDSAPQPPENARQGPAWASWQQTLPWARLWIGGIAVMAVVTIVLLVRAVRRRQLRRARQTIAPPAPSAIVSGRVPPQPVLEKTEVQAAYLTFPGDMSQRFILLPEGTTVGRAADNVLVVDATFPAWETVSTYHARIFHLDNAWRLEDLNSHNGVYVNGQRTGRNLLRDGWEIGIGDLKFIFHIEGGQP